MYIHIYIYKDIVTQSIIIIKWIYSVFLTYFESLCRSSLGEHLDKLTNIVTTVVVPLFLPQTPLYEKKICHPSGGPVKAIYLINKDDAI